jgi:broad specificity phosphatase PhoE
MLEVFLCRHGETEWNSRGSIQGHGNSDLTDLGHRQARAVAQMLSGNEYHALFCSSLGRAMQTAEYISKGIGLPIVPRRELWECGWGRWEGLNYRDLKANHPDLIKQREENMFDFRPPGGESYHDVQIRVQPLLDDIRERYQGQRVVIVAHTMINRLMAGILLDLPFEKAIKMRQEHHQVHHVFLDGDNSSYKLLETDIG